MDNLRSLDSEWYTKGVIGETVLMNMEYYLFNHGKPNFEGFTRWAMEFGLNKREIISIINESMVTETLGNID